LIVYLAFNFDNELAELFLRPNKTFIGKQILIKHVIIFPFPVPVAKRSVEMHLKPPLKKNKDST